LDRAVNVRWTPSTTALIVANLVPLAGVVVLDWDVFSVVFLFWLENLVVGGFNVLRMVWVERGAERQPAVKYFMIPFFAFHYGMFTLIHGTFVFSLFGEGIVRGIGFPSFVTVVDVIATQKLWVAVGALFLSHGYSFVANYLGSQEYRTVTLERLMHQPYNRVIVLHLVIILGGFVVMTVHQPMMGIVLLVVIKIVVDVRAHLREHRKLQTARA
jgi:hypothetical protein